jgi:hypothetical protein
MKGYPVIPAVFVLASAALLFYTFTDNLRTSAGGVVVILAGIPIYLWFCGTQDRRMERMKEAPLLKWAFQIVSTRLPTVFLVAANAGFSSFVDLYVFFC